MVAKKWVVPQLSVWWMDSCSFGFSARDGSWGTFVSCRPQLIRTPTCRRCPTSPRKPLLRAPDRCPLSTSYLSAKVSQQPYTVERAVEYRFIHRFSADQSQLFNRTVNSKVPYYGLMMISQDVGTRQLNWNEKSSVEPWSRVLTDLHVVAAHSTREISM